MLTLQWAARFEDNSVLEQYEKSGKEHLFKEVLDRQDTLKLFALINVVSKECYTVNLDYGYITKTKVMEEMIKPRADMLRKQSYEYRLIYFREVNRTFGENLQEIGMPTTVYFVGFQYLDKNGINHKRLIKIQEDGKWIVN